MSKQDQSMKMQSCVLKVNIHCHCDGCKKKIKKLLHKIDGVYNAQINAEQGKVIVTGNVDPAKLIKKLEKSGKHAELWGAPKGFNGFQNLPNSKFKNMQQFDHGKGGRSGDNNISQKGGKGGQQGQQLMQQYKGSNKDVKMPHKDQKSVKFDLQDDYVDASDDDFDDEFDDEFDYEDDDDEEEEAGYGHGQGQGHHLPNKMMPPMMNTKMVPPMMNNGLGPQGYHGMTNGSMFNVQKTDGGGGGNGKKGGGDFEIPVGIKGKRGSNNGNGEKKGGGGRGGSGDGKKAHNKGENQKQDVKDKSKSASKSGFGAFLSFGRKSKNGREETTDKSTKSDRSAAYNNIKGVKKGGSAKLEGQVQDFGSKRYDPNKTKQGYHEIDVNGGGNGGVAKTGPVSHMHPMANYGGMVNFPAMQGHPAMNGGAYQATGNPYNQHQQQQLQQQQYMAMMMNQQRQSGNDMFQPMVYARPQPPVNYMPPPPMPSHPMAGPYTDVFSDENTESCSIM